MQLNHCSIEYHIWVPILSVRGGFLMREMAMALLAATLASGGVGRAVADEDEGSHEHQSVTMADLPPSVQKTLNKEAKGGRIEELRKETRKDGTVSYEAEIVKNG